MSKAQEKTREYKMVEGYYSAGNWSIERVRNAVIKKWITAKDYEEITGETYER